MNLNRILQAEYAMRRIEARLSSLLEPELRAELADAAFLMAEVRHFAVLMHDAAQAERADPGPWVMSTEQVQLLRMAAKERLIKTCTPEAS